MGKLISASIDVTKINKSKLVPGKNGAIYCNLLISLNDEPDQYKNDVSVSENQSKEERERGDKKVYLGNGKTIWSSDAAKVPAAAQQEVSNESLDDLPF